MKETAVILETSIVKREKKALKDKKINMTVEERIEQLLEEDIYKLTDPESYS